MSPRHAPGPGTGVPLPVPTRLGPRDVVRLGLHGMRTRPVRAVLSALGIAIGIAAMVTVIGIPTSSQQALQDELSQLGTNLLRAGPGQTFGGDDASLPENADAMAARIAPVQDASATGNTGTTVRRTDQIPSGETSGLSVVTGRLDLLEVVGGTVREGSYLNAATEQYPAVVLGSVAAERLGIDRLDLAEPPRVFIDGQWFTVVGILDSMPLAPELDRSVIVGWTAAETYLDFDGSPTVVYVRADDDAVEDVRAVLGSTINPEHPNEVKVTRPSEALSAARAAESNFSALFLGLGGVALLVGGIGVANTMVISVLERRREIGLRRALGSTKRQIRGQFIAESVALAGLGGAAGVLIGVAATVGYAASQGWPATIPVAVLVGGVGAAAAVGIVAGLYPAVRASRLMPTEALA